MTGKSIGIAVIIAVSVVAIPLLLKGNRVESGSRRTDAALPRFVDLGTTTCPPCRVMLGVMEELKKKYPDEMIVEFVNVQEKPEEVSRYGIRVIPAQIFYDPSGKELYRHIGVFRTEEIIEKWADLGFRFEPPTGR